MLVSDTAAAFMSKVEDTEDEMQLSLTSYALECVGFPWDFNIARIPMSYFYDLGITYKDPNRAASTRISQIFSSLLEISVRHMVLPPGTITGSEEVSDVDYDKRDELLDTISDCNHVLGIQKTNSYLLLTSIFFIFNFSILHRTLVIS